MPISGQILYPFRWWYRATIANSVPIPNKASPKRAAKGAKK